ncbi:hypothetical protein CLU96_3308 [Chryseobacterium sp. 52]|nr:hypothetical protein CLU96_3308 [Chryseobacterium sp. 52]
MKLSNSKYINTSSYLLGMFSIIIILCLFLLFLGYFNTEIKILGICIIIGCLTILAKIRCFEYKNTAGLLLIKSFHPFDKRINFPVLQLPIYKIASFEIKPQLFGVVLYLDIKSRKGTKVIKYYICGFNKNQINQLEKSLNETILDHKKGLTSCK